ncbi:MAG: hypothetical protein E7099_07385 [Mediterranea massiliensis]|nr:hypothetical protein [Mediterranea massiliensis]
MKKFFKFALASIVTVSTGVGIFQNMLQENFISDLALENIEALADNESIYDYKKPKTVACDDVQGFWHTASVERICVFSAVPSTCTPVACGTPWYD